MAVRRDIVSLGAVAFGMLVVGIAFFAAACALSGCSSPAVVDEASPRCEGVSIAAGSDLTESSQYVEVRLAFDAPLETSFDPVDDLDITLNGEPVDSKTIAIEAVADGSDLVVRLAPTAAADGSSSSVYFALYDGLLSVGARSGDGGLAHVKAAKGGSNAVLDEPKTFTVPSGIKIGSVESAAEDAASGVPASVSFTIEQFAQLRCCTWFSFGDGWPLAMMHNHEFLRDTQQTCAQRLADTVNTFCGDELAAETDGARVTVRALKAGEGRGLAVLIIEGEGANPAAGVLGDAPDARGSSAANASGDAAGASAAADGLGDADSSGTTGPAAMGDAHSSSTAAGGAA